LKGNNLPQNKATLHVIYSLIVVVEEENIIFKFYYDKRFTNKRGNKILCSIMARLKSFKKFLETINFLNCFGKIDVEIVLSVG
jgi:hypothetical protein